MLVDVCVVVRMCGALLCVVVRCVLFGVRCRCVLLIVAYCSLLRLCVDCCWVLLMLLLVHVV